MNSYKVQIKLQDEIVGQVEIQALEPERAIEMVADLIKIEVLKDVDTK
ncbi:MAG TPA: hypothetical protein VF974_04780 [Patescibacteria group bacterium]